MQADPQAFILLGQRFGFFCNAVAFLHKAAERLVLVADGPAQPLDLAARFYNGRSERGGQFLHQVG
ncbi:hypothetical protein D3C86_2117950 [compost metagenome]